MTEMKSSVLYYNKLPADQPPHLFLQIKKNAVV